MPSSPSPKAPSRHDWIELVAVFSRSGERWADRLLRSGGGELLAVADRALRHFFAGRSEEGWSLLVETEPRWIELGRQAPDLGHAVLRWRWSVVAYGHYQNGDLERADEALLCSHREIVFAIEASPCLLPLAHQCHELRIQRARVARAGKRWLEVSRHLRFVRAMLENVEPLCSLEDGTEISYRTLQRRYRTLRRGTEPPEPLASLLDPSRRIRLLTPEATAVYALPGWIVQSGRRDSV